MKHGSLFSGIGGFDLAAEWMGWENVFHCEWNPFGQKVLKHYWPNAISYNDITQTDFTIHRGNIDILTGGFPCQPYSLAGKRKGKEDERHLWPEMLRAIREIQPCWVVGENVYGLVNWSGGLVFHEVQADLEAEGYEVFPYVLPACAVNAPHRRDRIWFVAYRNSTPTKHTISTGRDLLTGKIESGATADTDNTGSRIGLRTNGEWEKENEGWERQPQPEHWENGCNGTAANTESKQSERLRSEQRKPCQPEQRKFRGNSSEMGDGDAANTNSQQRPEGWMHKTERKEAERYAGTRNAQSYERNTWNNFPTQPPICSRNDGLSSKLDGITFSKWRNESIKAYGNAIVPQVAYQIFKTIKQYEQL